MAEQSEIVSLQSEIVSLGLKDATIYACQELEFLLGKVSRGNERWVQIINGTPAPILFDEFEWPFFVALVQAMDEDMRNGGGTGHWKQED